MKNHDLFFFPALFIQYEINFQVTRKKSFSLSPPASVNYGGGRDFRDIANWKMVVDAFKKKQMKSVSNRRTKNEKAKVSSSEKYFNVRKLTNVERVLVFC